MNKQSFPFSVEKRKPTFTSVLQNRGFSNLWINQILISLSYNALNFALIIWVFRLTDSNTAVSALLFSIYLPAVILGLFAGVLVDVTDRKKIIMGVDLLLCFAFISLIFLKESYIAVLMITFLVNALVQFHTPAEASAMSIIVKKRELIIANSIFSATFFSCFLIGFGLAGPLINHLNIDFVFGAGAFLLGLAFLLSLIFPSIYGVTDEQGKKLITAIRKKDYSAFVKTGHFEILQTIRLIKGKLPVLTSIIIMAGVQVVIGVIAVMIPSFFEKSLQIKATDASYIVIVPLGLGIVAGGMILGRIGGKLIKRKLVARAIIFAGVLFFLVGIAPLVSPAIRHLKYPKPLPFFYQPPLSKILVTGSFLLGIAVVSILVPSQTVLQENTPEKDRGKVFATLGVAMAGLSIIPVILSGLLADLFGTTPIFIGMGLAIFIVGLFGLNPSWFFKKDKLSYRIRQFLGLGHWE
ncbi:MFS transporter [Candidatus Daviesbacteria bacterium]|nr:MFS transporter [Candidatus Daviesbacteria bacterium]